MSDDLHIMYELHPKGGEVLLWCDGASDVGSESRVGSKCSLKEAVATDLSAIGRNVRLNLCTRSLSEKHQQKWGVARLKLWARCIVSEVHNDYDNPPNAPAFSGTTQTPKRVHHESFSDVVGGGAVAIVRALSDSKKEATEIPQRNGTLGPGISPSKAVDLRMKNLRS